jgi:segregation and condensation protein B
MSSQKHSVASSGTSKRVLPYRPKSHLRELGVGPRHPAALIPGEASATWLGVGPLARDERLARVEAVLLAADEPLPPRRIAQAAGLSDAAEARRLVRRLRELYQQDGTAFQIEEIAGGYQMLTRPEFHPWLRSLRQNQEELRLSAPARETLAIIAYRQPIMRADIEAIRGVQCGEILRVLMEKGLIRIVGRHPSLGRPVLYGTTRKFLQVFGLQDLKDLTRLANPPLPEAPPHPSE